MSFNAHCAFRLIPYHSPGLLQRLLRFRQYISLVEVKENICRKLDTNLGRSLLYPQVLDLPGEVLHSKDEVQDPALRLGAGLRRRPKGSGKSEKKRRR